MDLFDGQAIPQGGWVMPDEARRAIRTGITSPGVAGCGWVMMAVGSHLGSQLGYLPADDGLAAAVVIERRTCSCCRGEPRRRGSTPGPSGRSGIAGRSPLPRRGPGHAAAGRVAPDRLAEARQGAGEPALKPPQGALQVPVVRVAVDPAPLRHEVRELPGRLRVRLPGRRGTLAMYAGNWTRATCPAHSRRAPGCCAYSSRDRPMQYGAGARRPAAGRSPRRFSRRAS